MDIHYMERTTSPISSCLYCHVSSQFPRIPLEFVGSDSLPILNEYKREHHPVYFVVGTARALLDYRSQLDIFKVD